jgi:5-exo-hydroxycamphor dehydrogenase
VTSHRQAVFTGTDRSITLSDVEVGPPPVGGLIARVNLAGVCGTDAHRLAGHVPSPPHAVAFGHEATGVIEELGPGTTTDWAGTPVTAGDRITWFPNASCYRCHACVVLQNNSLCTNKTWPERAGTPSAAGFQEMATLHRNVVFFRIPDETSDDAVIAFGCGMPTAVTALARAGRVAGTETVLVQGSGPVGLGATLLARHTAARRVILLGAPDDRLAWGRRLGADVTIDITTTTPRQRRDLVRDLTDGRGADVVIEAAGVVSAFTEGLDLLAAQGRYVIAGLYSGGSTIPFDPVMLNNRNLQLSGSLATTPRDKLEGILAIWRHEAEFDLARFVSDRFPLAETRTAIESMGQPGATKSVVVPGA